MSIPKKFTPEQIKSIESSRAFRKQHETETGSCAPSPVNIKVNYQIDENHIEPYRIIGNGDIVKGIKLLNEWLIEPKNLQQVCQWNPNSN